MKSNPWFLAGFLSLALLASLLVFVALDAERLGNVLLDNLPAEAIGVVVGAVITYAIVDRISRQRWKPLGSAVLQWIVDYVYHELVAYQSLYHKARMLGAEPDIWTEMTPRKALGDFESRAAELLGRPPTAVDSFPLWKKVIRNSRNSKAAAEGLQRLSLYLGPTEDPSLTERIIVYSRAVEELVLQIEFALALPASNEDSARSQWVARHLVRMFRTLVELSEHPALEIRWKCPVSDYVRQWWIRGTRW